MFTGLTFTTEPLRDGSGSRMSPTKPTAGVKGHQIREELFEQDSPDSPDIKIEFNFNTEYNQSPLTSPKLNEKVIETL